MTERFRYNYNKNPWFGTYKNENLMKGNGVVYNSKFATNLDKTMGVKFSKIGVKLTFLKL